MPLLLSVAVWLFADLQSTAVRLPDYTSIKHVEQYATAEEYARAQSDARFRLSRVSYISDGLTVYAYVYAPVRAQSPLPVIVFNRGSWTWPEFAGEYLTTFNRLADAGFIVVAPMYRGSGGAAGRDEMGGADLDDLMNVQAVIKELPNADPRNMFMYGESRGGMMTYQAIREHFPLRAAAVYGAFTNLAELTGPGGPFAKAAVAVFPGYSERKAEIDARRSALSWAEKLDVPLLIMHGGADKDVPPAQSLVLAARLQELHKDYEIVLREGANHLLRQWGAGRDAYAVDWFRRHMVH
jgi:dipeptidyl aminopeptidase/acylaminoacyl peptidase